jgi:hypothetical protein
VSKKEGVSTLSSQRLSAEGGRANGYPSEFAGLVRPPPPFSGGPHAAVHRVLAQLVITPAVSASVKHPVIPQRAFLIRLPCPAVCAQQLTIS